MNIIYFSMTGEVDLFERRKKQAPEGRHIPLYRMLEISMMVLKNWILLGLPIRHIPPLKNLLDLVKTMSIIKNWDVFLLKDGSKICPFTITNKNRSCKPLQPSSRALQKFRRLKLKPQIKYSVPRYPTKS
jgi:hypothetical protein